ncbi:MAG: type VI secretion system ATPase TssH, partial [Planctomycetes bacterium]|nr:type VI secretion system ATPase TssH [Planctomycetota bacterium]
MDKFTVKAAEALQEAQGIALKRDHPIVDIAHLFAALIDQQDGVVPALFAKLGVDTPAIRSVSEAELAKFPEASGGTANISQALNKVIALAFDEAKDMGDAYVSTEHFLLAVLKEGKSPIAKLLGQHHIERKLVLAALKDVRGAGPVTSQDPEGSYQALEKYCRDLSADARSGKLDPVIGRNDEIRRVVQVLSRRTKNNP